jgi:quercetin dioxygenase-like cupin family protein
MGMRIHIGTVVGLTVIGLAALAAADHQAGAPPPGITRTELENNATVLIARLRMAPGAREDVHTHPFSAVVVQMGAGDVEMRLGDAHTTTRRAHGFVEFIPREVPHAAANVGQEPFDVVTIAMKPDRRPGGDAPASPAPAGITRTPVLENAEARVTHVTFASQAREPVHAHPFDLVVVQLTAWTRRGTRWRSGQHQGARARRGDLSAARRAARCVECDGGPFEILSVGIK